MSHFNLTRPLVCFDIESTGIDVVKDRIVEICLCKIHPAINGEHQTEEKTYRYNPGIPIPEEATKVHGISNADVADKPFFKQHAKGLLDWIQGCDLAGYNSNHYDIPLLHNEMERAGVVMNYKDFRMVDVCNIFKIKEKRDLSAALQFYCGEEHTGAHGAAADVQATVNILIEQLNQYSDLGGMTIEELALFSNYDKPVLDLSGKFTTDKEGVIVFNFGEHRGKPAAGNPSYLKWMVIKGVFPKDTMEIAQNILNSITKQ